MKFLYTICLPLFSFFLLGQTRNTDYQNIQGEWICNTSQYKNHTFTVKETSFFQKFQGGLLEEGLPYEIKKYNHKERDIDIVGLFVKCGGCFDDVWTISELTSNKLVLTNYETEEIVEYKKVIKTK